MPHLFSLRALFGLFKTFFPQQRGRPHRYQASRDIPVEEVLPSQKDFFPLHKMKKEPLGYASFQ